MDLEIVTIGDELLLGFTIDTNAAHLARELAAIGVRIVRRTTVGDDATALAAGVRDAVARTGAVITTGGLGPTADDRSKPAVAELFGRQMQLDHTVLNNLATRWRARFGVDMPVSNRQQAMVPDGATILENRHGSAPGIWLEDDDGRWVAMLPGVPREMRGMLADAIIPRLTTRIGASATVVRSRTIRTASISESALADRVGELGVRVEGLPVAFLPGVDGVDLRVTCHGAAAAESDARLDRAVVALSAPIERYVYGEGDTDLAQVVLDLCAARGLTIAVAESCTGGGLGARLTALPGSSAVVLGGTVAYANAVKTAALGVSDALIVEHGAVSEPVARAMASGACRSHGASVGVAITGIAGPGGGTPEKPVGTVWVAVDIHGQVHAVRGTVPGNRAEIRYRAAQLALDRIRRALAGDAASEAWTVRAHDRPAA